jgi:hypothetical protein
LILNKKKGHRHSAHQMRKPQHLTNFTLKNFVRNDKETFLSKGCRKAKRIHHIIVLFWKMPCQNTTFVSFAAILKNGGQ